jgi:hypothetical protein
MSPDPERRTTPSAARVDRHHDNGSADDHHDGPAHGHHDSPAASTDDGTDTADDGVATPREGPSPGRLSRSVRSSSMTCARRDAFPHQARPSGCGSTAGSTSRRKHPASRTRLPCVTTGSDTTVPTLDVATTAEPSCRDHSVPITRLSRAGPDRERGESDRRVGGTRSAPNAHVKEPLPAEPRYRAPKRANSGN